MNSRAIFAVLMWVSVSFVVTSCGKRKVTEDGPVSAISMRGKGPTGAQPTPGGVPTLPSGNVETTSGGSLEAVAKPCENPIPHQVDLPKLKLKKNKVLTGSTGKWRLKKIRIFAQDQASKQGFFAEADLARNSDGKVEPVKTLGCNSLQNGSTFIASDFYPESWDAKEGTIDDYRRVHVNLKGSEKLGDASIEKFEVALYETPVKKVKSPKPPKGVPHGIEGIFNDHTGKTVGYSQRYYQISEKEIEIRTHTGFNLSKEVKLDVTSAGTFEKVE